MTILAKCKALKSKRHLSSSLDFEGGSSDENQAAEYDEDEQYVEDQLNPDDPYQINNLNEIDHETLKVMYEQVVDELLDLQLEFEDKLAEAEEH